MTKGILLLTDHVLKGIGCVSVCIIPPFVADSITVVSCTIDPVGCFGDVHRIGVGAELLFS